VLSSVRSVDSLEIRAGRFLRGLTFEIRGTDRREGSPLAGCPLDRLVRLLLIRIHV